MILIAQPLLRRKGAIAPSTPPLNPKNTMSQLTDGIHHSRIISRTDRILTHLEKVIRQFNGEVDNAGDKISIEDAISSVRSAYELARDLRDFLSIDSDRS